MPDFSSIQNFLSVTTPAMPPETWWLAGLVLLVLGLAALIDSLSSVVPDPLIFSGLLAVLAMQGLCIDWPFAATQLTYALGAAIAIWGLNQLWYYFFKHDAIGMGDAKWTMLAVSCFGIMPSVFAWGIGACLAIFWMGLLRLMRCPLTHVYFAPFLFIGLNAGLWWLRLRDHGLGIPG